MRPSNGSESNDTQLTLFQGPNLGDSSILSISRGSGNPPQPNSTGKTREFPIIVCDELPALRQTVFERMACSYLYVARHIDEVPESSGPDAARGIEVHDLLAIYVSHLLNKRLRKELQFLDALLSGISEDAREALGSFRENHDFDPEKIVGTEIEIGLDENFEPVETGVTGAYATAAKPGSPIAYLGKLDLVILHSETEAEIIDWKTYYQIIDADTFQATLYVLLLFCWNPALKKVKFVLEFVRYGVSRSVEYSREDVPALKAVVQHARKRQRQIHERISTEGGQLSASPGRHCMWCPLLLSGCPLANSNPYAIRSPEDHLRYLTWLQEAEKHSVEVLKGWVQQSGPVQYHDDNGVEYAARFKTVSTRQYPCASSGLIVNNWIATHPDDRPIAKTLTMSGLTPLLKTKKRQELAEKLDAIAHVKVTTRFEIGRISLDETESVAEIER